MALRWTVFYLMGIQAASFDAHSFENLPWQTVMPLAIYIIRTTSCSRNAGVSLDLPQSDVDRLFKGKDSRSHGLKILYAFPFLPVH
jgi:hypothetical protein